MTVVCSFDMARPPDSSGRGLAINCQEGEHGVAPHREVTDHPAVGEHVGA